jgi:hypothetical protein
MATLIMRKQWKYLYAALRLLLLTISTLAGVGPVAAGDNGRGYGGYGEETPYEDTFGTSRWYGRRIYPA